MTSRGNPHKDPQIWDILVRGVLIRSPSHAGDMPKWDTFPGTELYTSTTFLTLESTRAKLGMKLDVTQREDRLPPLSSASRRIYVLISVLPYGIIRKILLIYLDTSHQSPKSSEKYLWMYPQISMDVPYNYVPNNSMHNMNIYSCYMKRL